MRNIGMNRYTIAKTSECQRYLNSIYFDAHSTNNCLDVDVSESLQKIWVISLAGCVLSVNVISPRNAMSSISQLCFLCTTHQRPK